MAGRQPQPTKAAEQPKPAGSALAIAPPSADAAALAALDEAGIEAEADGLNELRPSDFRTPLMMFNLKGKEDANGKRVMQDMFFDSIEQTTAEELNLALLEIHKTNSYQEYDNAEQRNRTICASFDQVQGTMSNGTVRPCKGCPDAQWRVGKDGKRTLPCAEVWNTFAYDLDGQKITLLRFKKTSLDAPRNHVQAHHLGKRVLPGGKRANMPLFTYRTRVTLKMHKSGNYALPIFERGEPFSATDLKVLSETSLGVRQTLAERLKDAEASGAAVEGGTDFDTDAYDAQAAAGAAAPASGTFIDG